MFENEKPSREGNMQEQIDSLRRYCEKMFDRVEKTQNEEHADCCMPAGAMLIRPDQTPNASMGYGKWELYPGKVTIGNKDMYIYLRTE